MSRVGVAKGDERYATVAKALQLIKEDVNINRIRGRRVLVKPNLVSCTVELAATHVDAVRAVIDFIQPFNPSKVIVAEGSATDTWKAFESFGYKALEKDYSNVKLVDLNNDVYDTVGFSTLDGLGKTVRVARTAKNSNYRFSVARAKTHDHVGCTLTTKNMLGCVPKGEHVWVHGAAAEPSAPLETVLKSNWLLSRNLVALTKVVKPDVGVIDGFIGMEGNGPVSGFPVKLRAAVASTDFVAADAVMAEIMGFNPLEIGYIHLADKVGLGKGDLREITILGERLKKVKVSFKPHSNYWETQVGWRKYAEMETQ